jgi:hypothetical protein
VCGEHRTEPVNNIGATAKNLNPKSKRMAGGRLDGFSWRIPKRLPTILWRFHSSWEEKGKWAAEKS